MMIQQNYRDILRERYDERVSLNSSYSLRAFARDIKIDPSRLSAVLKKKQGLSRSSAQKIGQALGFDLSEAEYFIDLVDAEHARSQIQKKLAQQRLEKRKYAQNKKMSAEEFRIISDWYHFAILELTQLEGFQSDPLWIAEKLDIPAPMVQEAIQRLIALEYLEIQEGGTLVDVSGYLDTVTDIPSKSIRKFHQQMLDKSKKALDNQPIHQRDFSNLTMSFSQSQIPAAKKLIAEFRKKFADLAQEPSPKDAVYSLEVGFFRLDNDLPKENTGDHK